MIPKFILILEVSSVLKKRLLMCHVTARHIRWDLYRYKALRKPYRRKRSLGPLYVNLDDALATGEW